MSDVELVPEGEAEAWQRSRARYEDYDRQGHLGFASPLHQRLRYEALLRHVDPTGLRILDFGCGHGALLEELVLRGRMPAHYRGVDLLDASLVRAGQRADELLTPQGAARLTSFGQEIDGSYDLVCALAVLSVDEGPDTVDLWRETIEMLWAATERTLVFDLLRREPGFEHEGHHRLSMPDIAAIVRDLSPNHLIDATLADHFAIAVVHRDPTASRRYWQLRGGAC